MSVFLFFIAALLEEEDARSKRFILSRIIVSILEHTFRNLLCEMLDVLSVSRVKGQYRGFFLNKKIECRILFVQQAAVLR